ncbi:MAG: TlpA family protein disulfide reductase [Planctomycetes bacterium]|nr:TlpA family protein disulfide reductase [Planctomycetota bacterium]
MKHPILRAALLLALPAPAQQRAAVGETVPEFSFATFLDGDGRQKLSDFRGQPVAIVFFGMHSPPCVNTALPAAIQRDHRLAGSGLATVLVHSQEASLDQLRAFLLRHFPDNDCFVAPGGTVPTPAFTALPHLALIGADGRLVWDGPANENQKQVDEVIAAELAKRKRGFGESAALCKVRSALYGHGDLGGAFVLAGQLPEGEPRTRLLAEVEDRYAVRKYAVAELQDSGRFGAAQAAAKALLRDVAGKAEWLAEVQPLVAAFETEQGKAELAASRKLERAEKLLRERKTDAALKALEAVDKGAHDTAAARRARNLLRLLGAK